MIQSIRPYKDIDYELVASWHKMQGEPAPERDMMPLDSSFVVELDGVPVAAIAVYLPNTPSFAMLDNLVGNPEITGLSRRDAVNALINHCKQFAQWNGYKRIFCLAYRDKLVTRYKEFGFRPTLQGVTTLIQEV